MKQYEHKPPLTLCVYFWMVLKNMTVSFRIVQANKSEKTVENVGGEGDAIEYLYKNKWMNITAVINIMEWSQAIRFYRTTHIALDSVGAAAAFASNSNLFGCKQMCIAVQRTYLVR